MIFFGYCLGFFACLSLRLFCLLTCCGLAALTLLCCGFFWWFSFGLWWFFGSLGLLARRGFLLDIFNWNLLLFYWLLSDWNFLFVFDINLGFGLCLCLLLYFSFLLCGLVRRYFFIDFLSLNLFNHSRLLSYSNLLTIFNINLWFGLCIFFIFLNYRRLCLVFVDLRFNINWFLVSLLLCWYIITFHNSNSFIPFAITNTNVFFKKLSCLLCSLCILCGLFLNDDIKSLYQFRLIQEENNQGPWNNKYSNKLFKFTYGTVTHWCLKFKIFI